MRILIFGACIHVSVNLSMGITGDSTETCLMQHFLAGQVSIVLDSLEGQGSLFGICIFLFFTITAPRRLERAYLRTYLVREVVSSQIGVWADPGRRLG